MGLALSEFKESLALSVALIKLEKKYPATPDVIDRPFVKGLRGAAAVLMVASFEFFVRRIFEENISTLNTNPPSIDFSKLPSKFLEKNIFHSLKRTMEGPQFIAKPPLPQRIEDTINMCRLLINEHLNPDAFSETGSNPNGERVKEKFNEIGVENIFGKIKINFQKDWKTPVADTFIKDTLDSIVKNRHIVAHTADTLNITRQSLNDNMKFLKVLSKQLEKEIKKQVKHLAKSAKRTI